MNRTTFSITFLSLVLAAVVTQAQDYYSPWAASAAAMTPVQAKCNNDKIHDGWTRKYIAGKLNKGHRATADAQLMQTLLNAQTSIMETGQLRADARAKTQYAIASRQAQQQLQVDLSQKLIWPRALRGQEFASGRKAVESLLQRQTSTTPDDVAVEQIQMLTDSMFTILKQHRDDYSDHAAAEAKRYLDALVRAAEFPCVQSRGELASVE